MRINPSHPNAGYRFRARVQNSHGWSGWSGWSTFDFGQVINPPPPSGGGTGGGTGGTGGGTGGTGGGTGGTGGGTGGTGSGGTPAPTTPGNLSPDGTTVTGSSATLNVDSVANASQYEFDIEYWTGSAWTAYYTYTTSGPTKTFYPAYDTDYRFRVRAANASGWSDFSSFAKFTFSSGSGSSGGTGSGGTGSGRHAAPALAAPALAAPALAAPAASPSPRPPGTSPPRAPRSPAPRRP